MRLGYACITTEDTSLNQKTTTATWVSKNGKAGIKHARSLAETNVKNLAATLLHIRKKEEAQLFRIGSGLLPLFSHPVLGPKIYTPQVKMDLEIQLNDIGTVSKAFGIKLSTHPDQYTVINSLNPDVVANSVRELEYHGWLFHCMRNVDYTPVVNIHGGRKADNLPKSWRKGWKMLPKHYRRFVTVENDEYSCSLKQVLELHEEFGLRVVFDIHHHWVHEGYWLRFDSKLAKMVQATWGKSRPKMHVSISKPELYGAGKDGVAKVVNKLPKERVAGCRAHSQFIWSQRLLQELQKYGKRFDLMIEAKAKDAAVSHMREYWS